MKYQKIKVMNKDRKKINELIKFIKFRPYTIQQRRKTVMGWETQITLCLPDKYYFETPRYKLFWLALKLAVRAIIKD